MADLFKSTRAIKQLLVHGANKDIKDKYGKKAIDLVTEVKSRDLGH
jgi:hypothetical protein